MRIGLWFLLLLLVAATGCSGDIKGHDESEAYYHVVGGSAADPAPQHHFRFRLERTGNVTLQEVHLVINGQDRVLPNPPASTADLYEYLQPCCASLNFHYVIKFRTGSQTVERRVPDKGEYQVPYFGVDADIDQDLVVDRADNCAFHANPDSQFDQADGFGIPGDPCAGRPDDPMRWGRIRFELGTWERFAVRVRDNTGPLMLEQNGIRFFAFEFLDSSDAAVTQHNLELPLPRPPRELVLQDCQEVYQDGAAVGERYVQIYAAKDSHRCMFRMLGQGINGLEPLLEGESGIMMVVTDVASASGTRGLARAFGRVTLKNPGPNGDEDSVALYNAVLRGTPSGYLYFWMSSLRSTVLTQGRGPDVTGVFDRGSGAIVFPR
jgi:hypothetical protein